MEYLTNLAKSVFITPIKNWKLFYLLKKKIEAAHQISDDLKEIKKERILSKNK